MNFSMALRTMKPGMCAKTLSMSGYISMFREASPADQDYPNTMAFIKRDGAEVGEYRVSDDGHIANHQTPAGYTPIDPELFNEILFGDWKVIPTDKAEAERTNPGIW